MFKNRQKYWFAFSKFAINAIFIYMQYIFILGQNYALSFAEIQNLLKIQDLNSKVLAFNNDYLIIDTKQEIQNLSDLQKILGGCI